MLMQKDATPAPVQGNFAPNGKQPRFLDADPPRPAPLGRLHTDDEARLAAEIEKLR
ncbi:MAG: hypothetical protein ACOYMK_06930 [Hyphomonadaceae bacterium]|jgi:hypothetical protein